MVSAVAAPRPEMIPAMRPPVIVREMQRTLTGPTGMAIASPASTPRRSRSSCFIDPSIMKDVHRLLALFLVLPLAAADQYLFTSFRRNGETGVFFAASADGRQWTPLKGDQPWLKPEHPGMLMRDPWLGQGPDGTWHMLWTWGWTRKEAGGKLQLGYSSSKDLIHWSPQRAIPVMQDEPTARNAWAPEAVWDAANKEWIVFWSTTIPGRFPTTEAEGDSGYNHRVYSMTTKDWQTF